MFRLFSHLSWRLKDVSVRLLISQHPDYRLNVSSTSMSLRSYSNILIIYLVIFISFHNATLKIPQSSEIFFLSQVPFSHRAAFRNHLPVSSVMVQLTTLEMIPYTFYMGMGIQHGDVIRCFR